MFLKRAIAVALVATATLTAAADADPVTAPAPTWSPDGEVKAIAVSGSTAYIGGNFSRIAPYTGSSALFDAASGAVQKPWPEVNGVVNDVVPDGSGGWYLGGDFKSVGGVPRTDLAHALPDGTLDPSFAPTTNGEVRALAVGGGSVFAGGEFSQANGTARGNLAAFSSTGGLTGFTGSVSGGGTETLFDPLGVHALLLKGSKLYVGGEFNRANDTNIRLRGAAFAVGNGALDTSWKPNTNRLINGLALDSDGTDVFIGGRFSQVDGPTGVADTPRNGVAKVSESTGVAEPDWISPVQGSTDLTTLMVFGSQVYIAGTVNVAPGDQRRVASYSTANNNAGIDNNWHPTPAGSVQSLAASGSTVYIGSGAFIDGLPQPAIMGVDKDTFAPTDTPSFAPPLGRGRQQISSGQSSGVGAIAVNGSDVVAGGTFTHAGGVDRRNLGAIDLTTGEATSFNPPMRGQFSALVSVNALVVTSDGVVWAGGQFLTEAPNERTSLAAFDPASGALLSFHQDLAGGGGFGADISALVASGTTVYAGGSFSHLGGVPRSNVAAFRHVPGAVGEVLPFDPDVDRPVRALALAGDTLYLGGEFSSVNRGIASLKRDRRNLAAVDRATGLDRGWDPDADNAVRALALDGGTVFAGGDFATVNRGTPRSRLAAFDGQNGSARSWDPGADGTVRSLATFGPTVFAGGDFATAGGAPRQGVADFDAQSGAPDAFSPSLETEERSGPTFPPVARVGALFASPGAGLLMGGTYVLTGVSHSANLARFGLAPLPVAAGPGGETPGGPAGGGGAVTPGDGIAPGLSALTASARTFRVGPGATPANGTATAAAAKKKKRPPRGTTLTLRLSEPAGVKFEVFAKGKGRKVGKRCVKQTKRNRKRKKCTRLTLKKPAFTRSAPAGRSKVKWSGRLGRKALKRGFYVLRATPTDAAGNTGKARQLSFKIVR